MEGIDVLTTGALKRSPAYAVLNNPFEPYQKVGALLLLQAIRKGGTPQISEGPPFICVGSKNKINHAHRRG